MLAGVLTPPELAQDRLVLLLPGPLFAFAIEHLLYLGKPLLFGGLLLAQVVVGGLLGLLAADWRRAALLAAGLWLLNGALLLPATGAFFAGEPRVALISLLASAAYAVGLVAFGRQPPTEPAATLADRRRLLGGGALLLVSAVLARRVVETAASAPVASSAPGSSAPEPPPVPGVPAPITPPDAFYVVSKNLDDPVVDPAAWHLQVVGLVDRPLDLRYDDLTGLPVVEEERTLECISNEVGGDLMSNGRWTGFRLADLLQAAGLQDAGTSIAFTSVDGYVETMDRAKALDPSTLLVYRLDGQPLPAKHGFPLRVLSTGTYGMKNPKWLTRIEATQSPPEGFWEQQGWDPAAPVATMTRIDTPTDGASIAGDPVQVAGVAFAADRGIQRVEVSADGGQSWAEAQLVPPLGPSTWTFWQFAWRPAQPGPATLVARAVDGAGQPQTERSSDPFPRGATGYHSIQVRVGA